MGAWIRENVFLAAAIVLPVALVTLFTLATYVPRLWVDLPQYDLLMAYTNPSKQRERYGVSFHKGVNGAFARITLHNPGGTSASAELYRYIAATDTVVTIPFTLTEDMLSTLQTRDGKSNDVAFIDIALADQGISFVADRIAPDGYSYSDRRSRSGIFGEIFGMRSRAPAVRVSNRGRTIAVPYPDSTYWGYANVLGWIEPEAAVQ
jgi:hypothetical protein